MGALGFIREEEQLVGFQLGLFQWRLVQMVDNIFREPFMKEYVEEVTVESIVFDLENMVIFVPPTPLLGPISAYLHDEVNEFHLDGRKYSVSSNDTEDTVPVPVLSQKAPRSKRIRKIPNTARKPLSLD